MSELLTVEQGNAQEVLDMDCARQVAETLTKQYPGHLWAVAVQGEALVVKNLMLSNIFGPYGFLLPKHHSASHLADLATRAGGELLERARMKRGQWTGELPTELEGADPRFRR